MNVYICPSCQFGNNFPFQVPHDDSIVCAKCTYIFKQESKPNDTPRHRSNSFAIELIDRDFLVKHLPTPEEMHDYIERALSGHRQKGVPIGDLLKLAAEGVRKQPKSVPELLRDGAMLYEERNRDYGNSYKSFGSVMAAMFPDGLPESMDEDDWNRLGVFNMIVSKVIRYASSFERGGHLDSAKDLSVYAMMLAELNEEQD